jgi:hypothetical protein
VLFLTIKTAAVYLVPAHTADNTECPSIWKTSI